MSRYVFDIETDNLLFQCTRCWIVRVVNLDTGEGQHWLEGDFGWMEVFDRATLLIGHNIIDFDLAALDKLFDYKVKKHTRIHDTLIMSLILNYNREGHSLEAWGEQLGFPKIEFNDFEHYSEEMLTYCIRDVDLTVKVYETLCKELALIQNPYIRTYLRVEHAVSEWCIRAKVHGWPFDVEAGKTLLERLEEEVCKTRGIVQPLLGMKTVAVDKVKGVVEPKKPRWIKNGGYAAATADWFGIPWESGADDDRLVEGEYSRVLFEPLDLDSVADVKIFLFRNGWKPIEFNTKFNPETKRKEKTSPKITEESLEPMQGNGKLYCDFLTNKSRRDILKGWLTNVDEKGFLHGEAFTIGTPSMRLRHNIIVNVPSSDSPWGAEMRALFRTLPGWKLIGCDSAGNQARGLAHNLKSPEYIDLLLNGDIHQYNADALTEVLRGLGYSHTVTRPHAKRILYAFLFGAAGDKMISYTWPGAPAGLGNKFKNGFSKKVPGLKTLLDKLENVYGRTKQYGDGYIPGPAGNRIYCDSFHKLLVYLLQAYEKATCGASLMLAMERLEDANIPYIPCIFMHDEIQFMVPEEHAEAAGKIGKQCFKDGPKLFGIEIMDGEYKVGDNWHDTH